MLPAFAERAAIGSLVIAGVISVVHIRGWVAAVNTRRAWLKHEVVTCGISEERIFAGVSCSDGDVCAVVTIPVVVEGVV